MKAKGFTTRIVHSDRQQQPEAGAVHQPLHNSVLFEYPDVQGLIDVFQGKSANHAYARSSTPSVVALQNMICDMEGGVSACVFTTGMSAISTCLLSLLKAGDHIIVSHYLFGNTNSFMQQLEQYGIDVDFVDVTDAANVQEKVKANTRIVFTETIANPVTQVADIEGINQICKQNKILFIADTTMTPAYLFDAKSYGVDLIVGSLTKYFGGHGNALGGWVTDTGNFDWQDYPNIADCYKKADTNLWGITQIKKKGLRDMGGSIASEACHLLSVGAETLALRLDKICANALNLAAFFRSHPKVAKVYYPGLPSHPQHQRAADYFKYFGGLMSIDLVEGTDCIQFLNDLQLVINSTHLGDNRTLAIPVAPTIYYEMGLARRQEMGISENMIRLSIGIEDLDDLIADFEQALAKV
ncbi:cystathionine gamma-synthase family protein [Catenovulum sp. SM1970]|uniref:cystathionine gamma-synthase family protein n=1 Tax=Marinifaba aquimaris TaxID=2741323 RepID=UPI001571ACA1|nr:cystathionine gamma-synthase family protein [Marinifaba aquimaris]NTS77798.1 cystathionine gamma-synthase family protein [Marinifaba aquimaris]